MTRGSDSDSGQGPAEASVCLCASTLVRWVKLYTPTLGLSMGVYRHAALKTQGTLGEGEGGRLPRSEVVGR